MDPAFAEAAMGRAWPAIAKVMADEVGCGVWVGVSVMGREMRLDFGITHFRTSWIFPRICR